MVFEGVKIVLDVDDRCLLQHPSAEERVGRTLGSGTRFCRFALGRRRLAVSALQLKHSISKRQECERTNGALTAGTTEAVLGVGLKDDAFTFNRLALVGERGAADALFVELRPVEGREP